MVNTPKAARPADDPIDLARSAAALVALLAAERDERLSQSDAPRRTEVLLSDAGLSPHEIARLTGKTYAAVVKAIQRAKAGGR
jgi:DNA-directed RNA polymerase specialized sigma24 family protein